MKRRVSSSFITSYHSFITQSKLVIRKYHGLSGASKPCMTTTHFLLSKHSFEPGYCRHARGSFGILREWENPMKPHFQTSSSSLHNGDYMC